MRWLCLTGILLSCQTLVGKNACDSPGSYIVVTTFDHRLRLCEAGTLRAEYHVSLGRGGVGKTRAGDRRTPLGTYALGSPRSSPRFHKFIPVDYPTAAQKSQGYTGADIGIHGPASPFAWLGTLTTLVDWTQGCIAVGSNGAIDTIAAWIRKVPSATIRIE